MRYRTLLIYGDDKTVRVILRRCGREHVPKDKLVIDDSQSIDLVKYVPTTLGLGNKEW